MYEKEKDLIKKELYNILTLSSDKYCQVDYIFSYIEKNINILWDVVKNDKR